MKCVVLLALLFKSQFLFAEEQAKAVMTSVYDSFVKIIPYVYADKNASELLKDSANQKELIKNLTNISESFKSAKHVDFLKKPGFRPSLETINSHIDETIASLKSQNTVFAQNRLKSITALCVSCHSQLPEHIASDAFGVAMKKEKRGRFESDFAYANYLYLVRRETEAVFFFDQTIRAELDRPASDTFEVGHELSTSFRRVLAVYTKIQFEPEKAKTFLKKYRDHKNVPKILKADIDQWLASLEKWKKFNAKKVKSVDSFITKYLAPLEDNKEKVLSGDSDVTLLVSSGILSRYLAGRPDPKLIPRILYFLAIAESRLSNSYYFSLSDLYLKECVFRYPMNPYAKKCYKEYEENIEFGFSGSAGTDIPPEEKRELDRLKEALK